MNSAKVLQSATYTDPIITNGPQSISLPYPTYTLNFTTDVDQVLPVIDYVALMKYESNDVSNTLAFVINSGNMLYNDSSSSVIYPTVPVEGALFSLYVDNSNNPFYRIQFGRNTKSTSTTDLAVRPKTYYYVFGDVGGYTQCGLFGYLPSDSNRVVLFRFSDLNPVDNSQNLIYIYKRVCLCSIDV